MKRFVLSLSLFTLTCSAAVAQEFGKRDFVPPAPPAAPVATRVVEKQEVSPSDLDSPSMSQEMWFYTQELRRYDDPKQAVRRKAEQKAADRSARLAALKWYGYSNLRPQASAAPWMGTYSPYWAGNSWDPYQHVGVGWPGTALRVEHYDYRR